MFFAFLKFFLTNVMLDSNSFFKDNRHLYIRGNTLLTSIDYKPINSVLDLRFSAHQSIAAMQAYVFSSNCFNLGGVNGGLAVCMMAAIIEVSNV